MIKRSKENTNKQPKKTKTETRRTSRKWYLLSVKEYLIVNTSTGKTMSNKQITRYIWQELK